VVGSETAPLAGLKLQQCSGRFSGCSSTVAGSQAAAVAGSQAAAVAVAGCQTAAVQWQVLKLHQSNGKFFLTARACKARPRGYTSCFVVVVVVAVSVAVACLLVLYSIKQFDNLTAAGQPRAHAVWYSATASGSLDSCHCSRATAAACMQFGILPLQVTADSQSACMQFEKLPLQRR
jgi:hypothetical protein